MANIANDAINAIKDKGRITPLCFEKPKNKINKDDIVKIIIADIIN